ncbi:MAG: hypothetical protein APF84_09240 [Gracilibacter sp. BRH_c7a]|nr:MAG: hypothetical protein APF84_09240 [Gracilibacter sp. BRH_c7a]
MQKDYILNELKKRFEFISEICPEQLDDLVEQCELEELTAGTTLETNFGECKGVILILTGEIRISKMSEDGREITLSRFHQGTICPLSAVCILGSTPYQYPIRVIAEKDTKIVWVSREYISNSLIQCKPFWVFIFSCIADSLYRTIDVVDHIAFTSIKKRLAQLILSNTNSGKHPLYTTHEALAREIGTAREVISRELKAFERAGFIQMQRGRLEIINIDELTAISNR